MGAEFNDGIVALTHKLWSPINLIMMSFEVSERRVVKRWRRSNREKRCGNVCSGDDDDMTDCLVPIERLCASVALCLCARRVKVIQC